MPDLQVELAHLALADRHIADARENLASVERSAADSGQASGATDSLQTLRETLAAFEGHRDIIVETIKGLRDGSLPDRT